MAPGLTLPGYTVQNTEAKLREYISSARRKFDIPEPDDVSDEEMDAMLR